MKKVVIIGAGISGLCTAYYLIREGYNVSVIDKGDMTGGASHINAGYLTPSHFITLAEPGMITQGLKWMLNSSSPLYIKPRWDRHFFRWAWHFKKAATAARVEAAIPLLKEINLKSRALYLEMQEEAAFDFHLEQKGLLMVYKTARGEDHELKLAQRAKQEGLDAEILDKNALYALEPAFSDEVLGGVRYHCDAHSTPHLFMQNLKRYLENHGVRFLLNEEVTQFITQNTKIVAVETEHNYLKGDEFVLAAGSWTFELARKLGLNIPIQGGKGYSLNVKKATNITHPAILSEAKCAVTPMRGFTRFAGTMEFSGNNDKIRTNRVEAIARAGENYYKDLSISPEDKQKATSGLRPVSPDGLPYIGRSTKISNLAIASGHAMMGWSLGPVTGKIITNLIMGKSAGMDIKLLEPERF